MGWNAASSIRARVTTVLKEQYGQVKVAEKAFNLQYDTDDAPVADDSPMFAADIAFQCKNLQTDQLQQLLEELFVYLLSRKKLKNLVMVLCLCP